MDNRLLLDTAILVGEIMLKSGAETYRVEDTMNRILRLSNLEHIEAAVVSTSIIATISDPSMDAVTFTSSIKSRDTNLNKIYLVNNISRKLCNGKIDLHTAHDELNRIDNMRQFGVLLNSLGIVVVSSLFPLLLGGSYLDAIVGIFTGILLAIVIYIGDIIEINSFVKNSVGCALITISAILINRFCNNIFSVDLIITGSIMSLMPGVTITNAVRDTLQGDYVSGGAGVIEASVKALSLVLGVAVGLAICGGY